MEDYTGEIFGRWHVLGEASPYVSPKGSKKRRLKVQCSCEKATKRDVALASLLRGVSTSCNCLHKELLTTRNTTHGLKNTKTYNIWSGMKSRCSNPQNVNYGARGITICPIWQSSFEAFLESMGECPDGMSIERKDNNLGYTPENCVWATNTEQSRNRRSNQPITYNGDTKLVVEWAEQLKINYQTLHSRLFAYNWPIGQALGFEPRT